MPIAPVRAVQPRARMKHTATPHIKPRAIALKARPCSCDRIFCTAHICMYLYCARGMVSKFIFLYEKEKEFLCRVERFNGAIYL